MMYCDSKVLETNWFHWLLATDVPVLERYRNHGLLWTKVIGETAKGVERAHCIAFAEPIYFSSYDGVIEKPLIDDTILSLESESSSHRLDDQLYQLMVVIPKLKETGYCKERPAAICWQAMLRDINAMCHGIATKFKQPSEDDRHDLAGEALVQVTIKLANRKLLYTPGRAPVFNLLTTTIYRCMFSTLNRRNTYKNNISTLAGKLHASAPDHRSLRSSPKVIKRTE